MVCFFVPKISQMSCIRFERRFVPLTDNRASSTPNMGTSSSACVQLHDPMGFLVLNWINKRPLGEEVLQYNYMTIPTVSLGQIHDVNTHDRLFRLGLQASGKG